MYHDLPFPRPGFPNGAGIPFPTRLRIPSKRWANRGRFLWHWCVKLTFARALLRFLLLARKHEVCVGSTNETKNSRSGSFLVPRAEGRHEKEGMTSEVYSSDSTAHYIRDKFRLSFPIHLQSKSQPREF